ncbi:tripartite tricarboxylate transporter substrate binding protein [uncultured Pseudacidovorax sp.]|uniref:Bug family tripartite tricarboxylate transporter substrate binding protein n=1 Tax=uncultured Pseudacidovorax sp. TaxID=679313 RepID=UPI0025DF8563|nr:tripartite tricarboxylate transporter substrate binding protein [uncultured Pseudacidovorax sp.]
MKRRVLLKSAALAAGACTGLAQAQGASDYPARPVTIVVPFAAGGSADVIVRALAQELSSRWGRAVVVDNRGGGNTVIATSVVAGAPADGYTLLCASYAWVTNQFLHPKLPYTPAALAPVTLLGTYPEMLFLRADIPATNVPELAAWVKRAGRPMTFANSGPGSSLHLAAAAFGDAAGIPLTHVSYRGSAPAMQDVAGGQVDAMFEGLTFRPLADGRRIRAMFVAQPKALLEWPELPDARQAGVADFSMASWFGLAAPARTPDAVLARIASDAGAALRKPTLDAQLRKLGLLPAPGTPAEYAAFLDSERVKLHSVISRNGITME